MPRCVLARFCKTYNHLRKDSMRPVNTLIKQLYVTRRLGYECPPNSSVCFKCKTSMRRYIKAREREVLRDGEPELIAEPYSREHSPIRNNSPNHVVLNFMEIEIGQDEDLYEEPLVDPLIIEEHAINNQFEPIVEPIPLPFPIPEVIIEPADPQNHPRPILWRSLSTTQNRCCICPIGAAIQRRCAIPPEAIMVLWITDRIFVNPYNRCCQDHLIGGFFTEEALEDIRRVSHQRRLSQDETTGLVERLSIKLEQQSRAFLNFDSPLLNDQDYEIFTSLNMDQFARMYETCCIYLPQGKKILSLKNCLALFLCKMRTNFSLKILGVLFGLRSNQEGRVSEIIQEVIDAINHDRGFVCTHLGFNSLTREEWFNDHGTTLTRTLYGLGQEQLCCILDETYLYCQKPSNHLTQSITYSMPKHRHLIKMMSVVSPSGRFYEMLGPYPCDGRNNDAAHLIDLILQVEDEDNIFNFFGEGDLFLVDRGYRDAIPVLNESHIRNLMPSSLIRGQRQHTDLEANRNRWITLIRELVERAHGRLKQKFKIFRDILPNHSATRIAAEFKIAAAMANAFFPRLKLDRPETDLALGERINLRLEMRNLLQIRLEEERLLRARIPWTNIDPLGDELLTFPNLDLSDIKYLTMGIYQLKMSRGYIQAHMKRTGLFEIQICQQWQVRSPNERLIKARMPSKFGGVAKVNTAYVSFDPNSEEIGHRALVAWYCDCKNGARVLGMCVHVTAIVFYLGFVRHYPDHVSLPSTKFLEALINNRLPPNNFEAEIFEDRNDNGREIPQDLEDQDH